ncbi:MAG TPA: crotonyl-CoA carboxylase/reductase [Polyangiaceae bacterium]|nr:crotonyl-CoA carboxylase/reductase [Polyangiaceae bacterium]
MVQLSEVAPERAHLHTSESGGKSIYAIGELPPIGIVPERMHALVVRQQRFGQPSKAMQAEEIPTPRPIGRQVLVQVMAAGVNFNGVWAASGKPVDVIAHRQRMGAQEPFHIAGSDASGIVWAVGPAVRNVKVGDHVVLSTSQFDPSADDILFGMAPTMSTTAQAWGYETNYGSFAQYTLVDDYQCHPKPERLSWAEAASYMLCGGTAYRQLMGWHPNVVRPGDPVLIWGGSGALGSMAIQITRQAGGIPVAVVSDMSKADHCLRLGAKGVIDRSEFSHWGRLPDLDDGAAMKHWFEQVRAFGRKFWSVLGERRAPKLVLEHPGEATIPTSLYLCDAGGMVVLCGGTSGYNGDLDLRLLWMRQKRVQGSHGAELWEYAAFNRLVAQGAIDPCLSLTVDFHDAGELHDRMAANEHPPGNFAVLVGAAGEP